MDTHCSRQEPKTLDITCYQRMQQMIMTDEIELTNNDESRCRNLTMFWYTLLWHDLQCHQHPFRDVQNWRDENSLSPTDYG